jgi:hypothetical protein
MTHELKHPLQMRGRGTPSKGDGHFDTVRLVVHTTSENHCLVSLLVTDLRGGVSKDTRLGECWISKTDDVGRPRPPYRLLQAALEKLLAQPGARLLPEGYDSPA